MDSFIIDYVRCSHCNELTDSDELASCDFGHCAKDGLCPNCHATEDGRDYCLAHFDVLEGVVFAEVA